LLTGHELERALADVLGAERVEGLRRLSGGASRETWSFEAVRSDGTREPLILRRETRRGTGMGDPAAERLLLEAAAGAGVPVPRVVAGSEDDGALGAPFLVTERVEGETIPRKILRDDLYAEARSRLATQCGEALARVHTIATHAVPGLVDEDQVEQFRSILDGMGQPHPAFELAFRWLERHRPPSTRRTLVHGDFRNGNLIVGPDGLRAVLDWELAHLGDPMEDLGWLCVKAWRFGVDRPVGGFGEREDLFSAYASASGAPVEAEVVRWWEVLGTLKWGVMCIAQAFAHLSGTVRSVELAAIGRRVCENEWDLLELLS
jgi:aminoglycoside phosphotransferase (APT) family kinase protein